MVHIVMLTLIQTAAHSDARSDAHSDARSDAHMLKLADVHLHHKSMHVLTSLMVIHECRLWLTSNPDTQPRHTVWISAA